MQPLTDEQAEALARRLVACKVWRWLPGMRTLDSDDAPAGMVVYVGDGVLDVYGPDSLGYMEVVDVDADGLLPDLSDPATLACVLQLWWQAWPTDRADRERMAAEIQGAIADAEPGDLADALVRAMEAAP